MLYNYFLKQMDSIQIYNEAEANFPIVAVPELLAGLIYALTEDNHLEEITACYTGGELIASEVKTALDDFHHGGWDWITQGILNLGLMALQVPIELNTCESMGDDLKAIEQWASIIKDPKALVAKVTKNYALHRKAIKADIAQTEADYAAGYWFQTGVDLGDLLTVAIGPIKPVYPTETSAVANFDAMAVPDWIAGFIYGMTGDNDLMEIEACFQGSKEMYAELDKAIGDFKQGGWDNITQGILETSLVVLQFPQALSTCEGMGDDLTAIEEWATIFTDPVKLSAVVGKNWLLHKRRIENDWADEEADWASGNYFNAGVDMADLLTTAVGGI